MSEPQTVSFKLSCFGCLGLIVIVAATLGLAWGLMVGTAHWVGGLFA